MSQKTVQQLDAYIKATAVVYDHSNTKLISRKTKVKPRKKQAFLSVLHYRKTTYDDCCAERQPSKRCIRRQPSCKHKSRSHAGKKKLQIFIRTPLLHTPKTLCFQLDPRTSILTLKELIGKTIGVEARCQRLYIRRNFELCDLLTLEDNGIEKDENISLRLSFGGLLGGGPKERPHFDKFLLDIVPKIETTWKKLANKLGFAEAEIVEIQAKNENDSNEQSLAMLFAWWQRQRKSKKAPRRLREALIASGMADLASEVPDPIETEHDQGMRGNDNITTSSASTEEQRVYQQEEQEVTKTSSQVANTSPCRTRTEKEIDQPEVFQTETQPVEELTNPSSVYQSAAFKEQLVLGEGQIGKHHGPMTGKQQLVDFTESKSSEGLVLSADSQSDSEEKRMTMIRATSQQEQVDVDDSHPHNPTTLPEKRQQELVEDLRKTWSLTKQVLEEMEPHSRQAISPPEQERVRQEETGDLVGHQWQKQQLTGDRDLALCAQMKHDQVASLDIGISATQPQPSTSSVSAVQKYGSDRSQHVSVDLNVGGNYDPIFLAPVKNTTVNFIQNVTVTEKRQDFPQLPIETDVITEGIKYNTMTNLLLADVRRTHEFPQLPIETEVTRKGTKDDNMTEILWLAMKTLNQAKGTDYVRNQVLAFLNSCDGELEQVKSGSVTFVVRIKSREGLNKLWRMYTTGDLAKKLTEILITDELTTEAKSDLAIQATILESDYEQACRFFDELGKDQQKGEEDSAGMKEVQRAHPAESSTATTVGSPDSAEHAADRCSEKMRTLYMTTSRYSQMVKWVGGDTKKILMPKLTLVKAGGKEDKRVISYDDMFHVKTREGDPINLHILDGQDDEQKSILLENIAYDWATGSNPTLSNFKLVTALQMEAIEQESDLIDSIYAQLLSQDTDIDRGDLESFIDTNPQKVLVLWDGFDRSILNLDENKFNSVLKFLNRMAAKGIRVLVTTRHSHKFLSSKMIQEPVTHVTASEVTEVEIEAHLKEINSEEPGLAEDLIDRIKSSGVLSDWAKSLMMIPLLCSLSKQLPQPDTISRLYSQTIQYIFTRQTDMSQEEISNVLIALGKTALEGLLSPQKRFTFKGEEFEKGALEKALDVGLLICQGIATGKNSLVQFAHKTFQDFCAALYCQLISEKSLNEFHEILDKIDTLSEFDYMLRFCCGDNDQCTKTILQRCHQNIKDGQTLQLALKCYFESQSLHQLSTDFMGALFAGRVLFILGFDNDSLVSLVWFLKHTAEQTALGRHDYLADVLTLTANTCDLSRLSVDMASCLSRMTNLSVLELIDCSLTSTALKDIVSSLRNMEHLRQLDFSFNGNLTGSAHLWASYLNSMDHVEELVMWGCGFIGVDFKYLAVSVGSMMHLKQCTFGGNGKFLFMPCVDGIKLRLDNCSLTGTDMADILQSMGNRPDVVTLILHSISGLGGVAYMWAQYLQSFTQITSIEISNCSLEGPDIEHIFGSVSRMLMVENISLEGNTSLSGTAKAWSPRLRYLRHVILLRLGNCSLTEDDQRFVVTEASSTPYVIFSSLDVELETDSGSESDSEAEYWKWYESAFA